MSSVVPLRSIRNEASEWLARLQSEESTEEDQRQFEAWAAADPERRRTFAALQGTWRRLELLSTFAQSVQVADQSPVRRRRWPLAVAAASAAVLVAGAALFVVNQRMDSFQTAIGEQRRIALPDASTVELNTDSRLAVEFKETERLVQLERGEARFKVAQQPGRPFVVQAADHLIRAVGTEFTVRIDGGQVKVLVVEGAVSVLAAAGSADSANPVMVRAGQAIASAQRRKVISVPPDEMERELAWHDGMVSFQGETLRDVLAEIARYNTERFTLADEEAASIRVSGYFRATDVPSFLARLQDNFPVQVRRGKAETVIASRASAPAQ